MIISSLVLIDKQCFNIKRSAKKLSKQHNIRKFYDKV